MNHHPFIPAVSLKKRWLLTLLLAAAMVFTSLFGPLAPTVSAGVYPDPISPQNNSLVTTTGYSEGDFTPLSATPLAIPEFSWSSVPGAKSYRLQISQNIGFSPVALETTTSNTSYTPVNSNNFPDGNFYWRVRVESPATLTSNYSAPLLFIKRWATPDNTPVLVSPAYDEALSFYSIPIFSWQPVMGAARYRFQIASSENGFNSAVYKYDTLALNHQPVVKLANNSFYWRVVPLDPNDREGTPSEVRPFRLSYGLASISTAQIPTLLSPADDSEPTFTPAFHWTAVSGAQSYELQYTSDPSCNFGNAGLTKTVTTRNTAYTPTDALPNDFNYCWHVRVHSGNSLADWSSTWNFVKRWYIQAVPLTPVNNYQYVKNPLFSWTPVPEAANYKIEVCSLPTFPCTGSGFSALAVNTYYTRHDWGWSQSSRWYWRVTPYDRNTNAGKPSDGYPYPRPASFHSSYTNLSPNQVYPLYYYSPSSFPSPDTGVVMKPAEDRSAAYPIFIWNRVMDDQGLDAAAAYEVQVDDDPLFKSLNWDYKTENLSAAPTGDFPFNPQTNGTYYWRVCSLASLAGPCPADNHWSQVWAARFNPSKALIPTGQPELLRPVDASEVVETMPLFEWWPVQGADGYQIQVSQDPFFGSLTIDEAVPYPVFSPQESLGQRSLNHLGFGTYYWRIRGLSSGIPMTGWSPSWRFQLAAQSQWREARVPLASANQLQVATDADDVDNDSYELTRFNVSQDTHSWYFGFTFGCGEDMAYMLYIDLDHVEGSGATSDPTGAEISTISAHRPEYAIEIEKRSGGFSSGNIIIYQWTGTGWSDNPQTLAQAGGEVNFSGNYVEIRVENTSIGMGEDTNSAALSLFSIQEGTHDVLDAVPTSSSLMGLDRFTSVSERMNQVAPPTSASGGSTLFSSVPPFFFDYPSSTPWEGFNIQISVDARFTTWVRDYKVYDGPFVTPPFSVEHTKVQDVVGDNTYYWRVRPVYNTVANITGSWSQPKQFLRQGFVPQNLKESISFATPTFSWDFVDGAAFYDIEVDDDPNFGSPAVDKETAQNSYTPEVALPNATYYWHVRVRRDTLSEGSNDWSQVKTFTLTLPHPTNLTPDDADPQHAVHAAPSLCWDPLVVSVDGSAILTAYKYKVQVSRDPNFSPVYEQVDTEQSCYTPTKGYEDGTYYWRVAMIDGNDHISRFSPPATFTKQYPVTSLLNPADNTPLSGTPTFQWTPVDGAASYKLEVSQYATFSPIYDSVTTNNTRYTPTKSYDTQKTYYWRVAIIDKDGRTGPFNNATILAGGGNNSESKKVFLPLLLRSMNLP